jgi:AcrR family transcriptional regulator
MPKSANARPRTKPPEERREELMNAASRIFLKNGVPATTIDQITAAAKVAKGTFYLHFSSKEQVLLALREKFAREFLATLEAMLASRRQDDWKGKLAAWVSACIDGYLDAVDLHDVIYHEFHPETRQERIDHPVVEHLAALLAEGSKARVWSVDDPQTTAVFLFGGIHSLVDFALIKQKRVNRAQLVKKVERLWFRTVELT